MGFYATICSLLLSFFVQTNFASRQFTEKRQSLKQDCLFLSGGLMETDLSYRVSDIAGSE
jgi:hypothetical protein